MSLLRLLTAGRSLVGLKKAEVRYHLPGGRALPSFGAKKNPFRATALPEKAESTQENEAHGLEETATPSSADPKQAKVELVAEVSEAGEQPDVVENVGQNQQVSSESPRAQKRPEHARASGFKAFLLWGRAKRVKALGIGSGKPLVQGELSLDSVKVVRNDLSECDLEVVRAKQPVEAKSIAEAMPKPVVVGADRGVAVGRLLGL